MELKALQKEDAVVEVTVKIKGKTEREFAKGIELHKGQPLIFTGIQSEDPDQSVHKYIKSLALVIERTLVVELGLFKAWTKAWEAENFEPQTTIESVNDLDSLINYLNAFPKTVTHGKSYGCDVDISIRHTSKPADDGSTYYEREGYKRFNVTTREEVIPAHIEHLKEIFMQNNGKTCYVRCMPEVVDENGYLYIRTRLQFGDPDKVIDPEKWEAGI